MILLACAPAPTPAEAYRLALAAETPVEEALELCHTAADEEEECIATVVRRHPDELAGECVTLRTARWRGECHFSVAEARAKEGDRWGALTECGAAGDFYNECLYHAWNYDLQQSSVNVGRAVSGIEGGRAVIAFWSGIETIGEDAEEQLWRDWWFFAHSRNKPANLGWCASLPDAEDQRRCVEGTRGFVERTVVETLIRSGTPPQQRDRICRGSTHDALAVLGELYVPDRSLDAVLEAGIRTACDAAGGRVERPWNPVFRARRLPP